MTAGGWFCVSILGAYFIGVGSTDVFLLQKMGRRIQQQHPKAWKTLGVSSVHTLAFNGYFRRNEHLQLHDPELDALVRLKRRFDTVTGIAFIVVTLSVGAWLRGHG
jgi:hypothetical protein